MPISRSTAISAVRNRIADTTTTYTYSDALLQSLLTAALREMETEIRQVDPDYFFTSTNVTGYTDALDPGTYEYYALPSDLSQLYWIERADLSTRPKLWHYTARDAERGRFPSGIAGTVTFNNDSFSIPQTTAVESVSVMGDRFRVLPADTATGRIYGVYYARQIRIPQGDSDLLDIPPIFEEATIQSTGLRAVERDEGPMAESMRVRLYGGRGMEGELSRAKRNIAGRTGRPRILTSSY